MTLTFDLENSRFAFLGYGVPVARRFLRGFQLSRRVSLSRKNSRMCRRQGGVNVHVNQNRVDVNTHPYTHGDSSRATKDKDKNKERRRFARD